MKRRQNETCALCFSAKLIFNNADEEAQTLPYVHVAHQTKNCVICIGNVANMSLLEFVYTTIQTVVFRLLCDCINIENNSSMSCNFISESRKWIKSMKDRFSWAAANLMKERNICEDLRL